VKRGTTQAELAEVHKFSAQSASAIAGMLARRRLNVAALQLSRAQLKSAIQLLDKVLESFYKEGKE
jgi:hypothetical protein